MAPQDPSAQANVRFQPRSVKKPAPVDQELGFSRCIAINTIPPPRNMRYVRAPAPPLRRTANYDCGGKVAPVRAQRAPLSPEATGSEYSGITSARTTSSMTRVPRAYCTVPIPRLHMYTICPRPLLIGIIPTRAYTAYVEAIALPRVHHHIRKVRAADCLCVHSCAASMRTYATSTPRSV